ncbi:GlxA family transcriptional regulator [Pseudomonas psychrophila]|uniref:Transcriptional regulator GlxA family, contains an amidase domain and an AraC-type DNA-binding HTH domain n=2 Tax=Pseudomonas psychrophila TaxID=122355 RepID=A0ABY0VLT6_9PSED|nr:GlxA family transcriptional regulator [Pseudomonas psychrophila]KMN03025.1 AraC family transcriptional regulator [Pseudomonas psychrophila]KOX64634.1 AraC family transcriptional regulator [Pseudomonas psychrophila]QIE35200.1 GlxA family transcriptional regulator [Pseudomonas psychrophila]SDU40557.1 Transcriptional regulator GlxA family, contains an amidase domain and an AraC-type DNA-binding HTH domain [Pseudomonas psychrophila]
MSTQRSTPLRRVSILAIDRVFASTLMHAKDFFHLASLRHGKQLGRGLTPTFETRLVSPDGQPAVSFSNVVLPVDGGLEDSDIIILPAFGEDFDTICQRYPQVLPWLREQHARGAVLCAEATGVFWLAEAGLLDGKEATTYWRFFDTFAQRYPEVHLNQDKHLTDADNLYCAGGPTSACDLYIYMIERFCGANIAQAVARDILYEVQRNYTPGRIGFGGQKLHQDVIILQIQQWLEDHFADKFRFEDVARDHGMSIRNFMRRFQLATGDKPLHYLQRLRIETAKGLLSASRKSIKTISYDVGYDDASFFARLFRQHTELSPNQYRQQFLQAGVKQVA